MHNNFKDWMDCFSFKQFFMNIIPFSTYLSPLLFHFLMEAGDKTN